MGSRNAGKLPRHLVPVNFEHFCLNLANADANG